MNAIVTIEGAPVAAPQVEWLNRGRDIAHAKVDLEWRMAEWIAEGVREGHAKQLGFDFAGLGKELGIAPPRLKAACKAAQTFPPALRDATLSVEHHAALASLPRDQALPLLKRAAQEHLSVNDCREVVTQHRYETGQRFDDEDVDSTFHTLMARQWNRSTPAARELFVESLRAIGFQGIINEDEAQ